MAAYILGTTLFLRSPSSPSPSPFNLSSHMLSAFGLFLSVEARNLRMFLCLSRSASYRFRGMHNQRSERGDSMSARCPRSSFRQCADF